MSYYQKIIYIIIYNYIDIIANSTQVPVSLSTTNNNSNNFPSSPLFDFDSHSPMYYNTQNSTSIPATPLSQLPFPSQIPNSRYLIIIIIYIIY